MGEDESEDLSYKEGLSSREKVPVCSTRAENVVNSW